MKKLLLKSMLLLCALIVGSGTMWAQSDKSAVHSSNVSLSGGTNCTVVISSSNYSGKKLGSNGSGGSCTFSAPSGTKYIHIHVAAWKAKSPTLTVKNGSTTIASNISLTSDESISGNSTTYSLSSQDKVTTDYYKVVTLSTPLTQAATITIQSVSERCAVWGVNTEEASTGEITTVTIDDSGITNTDIASGTAAGSLSAVVKDASLNNIAAASVTWSSSNTSVATIGATTGIVTLVKKGSTTITASYAGVSGTYQSSNNTYVLNVINSSANDGTSAKPFTVTEARDALDNSEIDLETNYYVRGYIAKIGTFSEGQLTYWVSDDGSMTNNLQCYKGKNVAGAAFAAATDLEVGDIATVKGKLKIYETTTYELDENNEVVSITPRTKVNIATFTATTNPLILGETETTETSVTNDHAGCTSVSYTYESDNETVATVDADGVVTAVAKGTANITVSPVVSATDPTYKVGESKSIEITVSNPSHTASFSINGVIDPSDNDVVEEDEDITFPADPADIGGKTFQGWTTAAIISNQTDAPAVLIKSAKMSTADITYYAVFATETTGTVIKTDELTLTTTGVSGNSYSSWTNKQATGGSDAVYSGCNAGGNSSIQLNATSGTSYRGIISTTSGGKLKKVTIEWNNGTSNGRSVTVYGSNSAYTTMSNFNSSKGTVLGSITKNTSTELTIAGDYTFVGFYATQAIYMNAIIINWETTGKIYSDYCTNIPTGPADPTTSGEETYLTTSDNMAGWRAFYDKDNSYSVDVNTKVYVADADPVGTTITLTAIEGIPADEAVILHTSSSADNYKMTLTEKPENTYSYDGTNKLSWETTAVTNKYRLGFGASGVGFYPYSGTPASGAVILNVDSSTAGARELTIDIDDDVTGISTMHNSQCIMNNDFYNLAGQRVAQPTKGLYIVNGRKVIIK